MPKLGTRGGFKSNWMDATAVLRRNLPFQLQDQLFDRCSLTTRLQHACDLCSNGGGFNVRVLSQVRGRPLHSERQLLGMRRHHYALIRQVLLRCGDCPWVFARTVIPLRTLTGRARRLDNLGSRPLGAMLFADKRVGRGRMQVARLQAGDTIYAAVAAELSAAPDAIWGRRSLFHYAGKPLLVNEIFLPDMGAGFSIAGVRPCQAA